jgi:hypothetical protein
MKSAVPICHGALAVITEQQTEENFCMASTWLFYNTAMRK